jgi:hypothetical protein
MTISEEILDASIYKEVFKKLDDIMKLIDDIKDLLVTESEVKKAKLRILESIKKSTDSFYEINKNLIDRE